MNAYAELLRQRAAEHPDRDAIRMVGARKGGKAVWTSLTFAQLDAGSDAFARGFAAMGLRRGDRTLMLVKPSLEFYEIMWGLMKLGAVPVLLDPGMGMKNLLACIEQIRPVGVVAIPPVHAVRTFVRKPFRSVQHVVTVGSRWFWGGHTSKQVRELGEADGPFDVGEFGPADEAAIIFTSGSTGVPKGVQLTHGMFEAMVDMIREMFGFTPDDTTLEVFAPFVFFDVCLGVTAVVPDINLSKLAQADPTRLIEAIDEQQPNVAFASPIVWANVLRWCQERGKQLDSFDRALTAGAPISADMHRRFREVVQPGVQLFTPYGATESMTVAHIGTDEVLGETWERTAQGWGTCVGKPAPSMEVRIVGITEEPIAEWSDELGLAVGEIGEICVKGPAASPEYKDLPEANAASKIRDGQGFLHRMGDLGYLDEQGRLWFCGRKKHRLETTEGMVPAVPVEGVFNEHPAVFRSAVVGMGERGQELPVLIVELEEGKTWSDSLAAEILALAEPTRWKGIVRHAFHHQTFPTDARHNSKIRRGELKEWVESHYPDYLPAPKGAAA